MFSHFTHVFQFALFFEGLFDSVVFVVVPDMIFVASVSKFFLADKFMAVLLKHSFQFLRVDYFKRSSVAKYALKLIEYYKFCAV